MKKRIFALVLALCMVLTMVPAAFAAGYHDTEDHWAEDAIARWSQHGIVEGNDGWFSPDGELSRGQLAAIIARLLKLPAAPDAGFGDTDGHWAEDVINRCFAAGIMLGDGVNANPDKPISREETMVMLGRALGIKPVEDADLSHYEDDHAVSDWAEGYVAAMTGAGIVNGIDGNLAPDAEIDRASTMTILDRAITTYVTEPGTTVESDGGIVLVAAEDVTVTGEAEAVVVTQGAAGGTTTLDNAKVGTVTVQAEESAVVMGEETVVVEVEVTETAAGAAVEVTKDAAVGTVTTAAAESTVSVSGTVQNVDVAENATAAAVTVEKNAEVGTVTTAAAESTVAVAGTVGTVQTTETAANTTVETEKGATITNVENKADNTTVTGNGTVENVTTSGNNTTVETNGTKVEAAEGTTGTTAGDKVVEGGESATTTPTTPSTPSVPEHYCRYTAVVTAPTCTEKGYTTYTCVCGDSYVDDYVDALDHDFTGAWKSDETGHWHECANGCGETDTKAAHGWLSNNCAEATECGTCGYDKAAGEHTWDAGEVTTAPTCTEKGEKTFTCTTDKCGATKTEPVAETGHSYTNYVSNGDATCEADGTKTAKCDNGCGETDTVTDTGSKKGHSYTEYVSDGNADCEKDGTKTAKCDNGCGKSDTKTDEGTKVAHQDGVQCEFCKVTEVSDVEKLAAAIANGGTVKLMNDITVTKTIEVTEDVTIDLNGKALNSNVTGGRAFKIVANNVDFVMNADKSSSTFGEGTYGYVDTNTSGITEITITINGGIFEGTTDEGGFVKIRDGVSGTVNLNNVTYTDNCPLSNDKINAWVMGVNIGEGTVTVNVTGGTYTAACGFSLSGLDANFNGVVLNASGAANELSAGTFVLENCDITLDPGGYVYSADGAVVAASNEAIVNINECALTTKSSEEKSACLVVYPTGGTINATDCTFTGFISYTYGAYEGKTCTINNENYTFIASETTLPKAEVTRTPEHENTDLDWGSYGAWSPTEGLDAQLEAAYIFTCADVEGAAESPYANWYCDFYVKLNRDLGANEVFLGGNYGSFGWVGFHNGDITLEANEEIALLGSVTTNPWTYQMVAENVGTFICGVGDVDDALAGATFTVMLRLTNPENESEFYNVATINYTFTGTTAE